MTVELEAAAADSLPHLLRGGRKHGPEPGAVCANCGAVLQGPFCHVCGQDSDRHKRSIRHLIFEAVEGLFELDGRLWRTLPALFFQPGKLARDYIEGRLARHVPPLRMFLVALVLFIFAAEQATHQETLAEQKRKAAHEALLATPQGRATEVQRLRAEAATELQGDLKEAAGDRADDLKDSDANRARVEAGYARRVQRAQSRYAAALARADWVARGLPGDPPKPKPPPGTKVKARDTWWRSGVKKAVANPDYYWAVVFDWGHRLAVILLPILGLSLALVYRKRPGVFFYDHLLVAMNLLSFSFLTNALGLILPLAAMPWWFGFVALWTPVNLFQTLRGAYGSSLLGAALKTLLIWTITVLSSLMLLTGLLVLAIAQL